MFSTISSMALWGIHSRPVQVEVDASTGLPCFDMVGMAGSEVKEARERVRVALRNVGCSIPPLRVTVNLSPADVRKEGTAFDVPIAVGILQALGHFGEDATAGFIFLGELGLNGEIKAIPGVLPQVKRAKEDGHRGVVVPMENAEEAALVEGIDIYPVSHLVELMGFLTGDLELPPYESMPEEACRGEEEHPEPDFSEVAGQETAKYAAQIAAAGFHHLLMVGAPGGGKTMIARRMPTIMPPLTREEMLEVTAVYSVAGKIGNLEKLMEHRPFCSPHHTITPQALVGGGARPKPGYVSLSHKGVLFLDELAEFQRTTLDVMRQPLEQHVAEIVRTSGQVSYPADFLLVAATNLCPCGFYPDMNRCTCTPSEIHRYKARLSGPLLNRIDLVTQVDPIDPGLLIRPGGVRKQGLSSSQMRENVMAARQRQLYRFRGEDISFNAQMDNKELDRFCKLGSGEQKLMERAYEKLALTARSYHRLLKVTRTIADLEDAEEIREEHIQRALLYRMSDQL
ncbi:MAG: YifB family Mg chelatase-like AAA ATPase [Lachnospiraceae bacterium]|nr:YifB family Mg chelatase-like AAA ATPase [Lachnospiraceae bacterium]